MCFCGVTFSLLLVSWWFTQIKQPSAQPPSRNPPALWQTSALHRTDKRTISLLTIQHQTEESFPKRSVRHSRTGRRVCVRPTLRTGATRLTPALPGNQPLTQARCRGILASREIPYSLWLLTAQRVMSSS